MARAAVAAVDHDFRRVLDLVTGDEVHRQPSVARITQEQPETCQQMTPSAVFCAERSPDQTTMVFRNWLGTCPCQCRSVHSARCSNDGHRPRRPREQVAGGGLGADERQSLQCRKILSPTSACGGSIKAPTAIWPPHCGHDNGSTSYTRLISIAQL